MIISLAGYMGSGKSHIATILSEKTGFKLIDLDKEITAKNRASVSQIFASKGELFFRKSEREVLEEVLATEENIILSLGGGTPAYFNNMEVINSNSVSFYLRASVGTLTQRLLKQKAKRPLIAQVPDEEIPEFVAKHLFERNSFYHQCHFTVDTDSKTPEEISDEIIHLLPV